MTVLGESLKILNGRLPFAFKIKYTYEQSLCSVSQLSSFPGEFAMRVRPEGVGETVEQYTIRICIFVRN